MSSSNQQAERANERAVLGCVLREPETAAADAARLLRPDDFAGHVERSAFQAMLTLNAAGRRVELAAVYQQMTADGHGDCLGGDPGQLAAWLTEVWEAVPTAVNLEFHAEEVRHASLHRTLLATAGELQRDAGDRIEPAADTAARFSDRLAALAADRTADEPPTAAEAVEDGLADLRERHRPEGRAGRVSFGYAGLDRLVPCLDPGTLTVVAARPGMGKTAFALNVASRAALLDLPAYFVSLEMGRAEIGQRLASALAGLRGAALRGGYGTERELEQVAAVAADLRGKPLVIDDRPARPVERVVATARRHQRRRGLGLLVVDYLQLVPPTDPRAPRREQVEHVSRTLKQAARSLGCPVLALCQLNRAAEDRPGGRPRMSDIREAGGIEQDADAVLLLSALPGQPDGPDLRMMVEVAKHRNGPTGEAVLLFRRGCSRFDDSPPGA